MKHFNYGKIQEYLKKGEKVEDTLRELITQGENQYFKFWLTNIELDFTTYMEISRDPETKWVRKEDDVLEKLYKYLCALMFEPEKLLHLGSKGHEAKVTTLNKYKLEIEKRVKVLTAYSDQGRILETIYNRLEGKYATKTHELETDEAFSGLLIQFIFNNEDPVIINDKIKQIFTQLPIRMTKNRFFNYVDDSFNLLKGIEQKQLKAYSEMIYEVANPRSVQAYGTYLMKVSTLLDELENGHDLDLSFEQYNQLLALLSEVHTCLDDAISYYLYAVNMINEVMGLLLTISETSLQNEPTSTRLFTELMTKFSEKKRNQPLIDEETSALLEQTEGIIEGLSVPLSQIDVLIENALITYPNELINSGFLERYENLKKMPSLSSGSYFANPDSELGKDLIVDEFYLALVKKELTQLLSQTFEKDTKALQRARMANCFSVLNVIHKKPQEVYEFILEAFVACRDHSEKTICKKLIRELMTEFDSE
ncbi:MAG: hypothetical protein H7X94_14235 [Vallitaleaceae bacterium]|nr:hypothetical protein [Vallitaleaceae bacterium]